MQNDPFVSPGVPGNDLYGRSGNPDAFCQEFDAQAVGGTFHGRCGQFDLQGIAMPSDDLILRGPGLNKDIERQPVRGSLIKVMRIASVSHSGNRESPSPFGEDFSLSCDKGFRGSRGRGFK